MPDAAKKMNGLSVESSDATRCSLDSSAAQSNGVGPDSGLVNGISVGAPASWIVQKFGGTSVGKYAVKIADEIVTSYLGRHRVACVVSARSAATKSEGTTSRLLTAAKDALVPGSVEYKEIVKHIRNDHLQAAQSDVVKCKILNQLVANINSECDRLESFLGAAQIIEEISPKTKDSIIGIGERLSAHHITAVLNSRGISAQAVILDNIVPSEWKCERGLTQTFYDSLGNLIASKVLECGDKVPVVTGEVDALLLCVANHAGYFGNVPGSLLSQIGRGYTDLCAALLAVGLSAAELQVWKEVDGIFTADPHRVPTARLLSNITPEEAAELTYYGSEVIHPFFTNLVCRASIPIRIKNVENPSGQGTVIISDLTGMNGTDSPDHPPKMYAQDNLLGKAASFLVTDRSPTAVTAKENIVIVNVHSNRRSLSHGFYATLFTILDRHRIIVDLISTSEVHVSMALHSEGSEEEFRPAVEELQSLGQVAVLRGMIILSLVGKLQNMVGIAAKMFTTLAANCINIEMISQGASEINISCVIDAKDTNKALNVLHHTLLPPR